MDLVIPKEGAGLNGYDANACYPIVPVMSSTIWASEVMVSSKSKNVSNMSFAVGGN
jgi:hypothetical protein